MENLDSKLNSKNGLEHTNYDNNDSCECVLSDHESETDVLEQSKNLETENNLENYHSSLYKRNEGLPNQSKRREELLNEQKRRRNKLTDESRDLFDDGVEFMEAEQVHTKHKRNKNRFRQYKNKIMLSEWLVELPDDLDVNWFVKLCPAGHRCLVVAQQNVTKEFNKFGIYEARFKSVLPGGTTEVSFKGTILDCIWVSSIKTFYVLDVLTWAGQKLTDYDAEFRFFWLQSKMHDLEELSNLTPNNTHKFIYINHYSCDYSTLNNKLENYPFYPDNDPKVDGLLFYHKEASYTAGRTPLVGWLKPYMVPEVLNVNIDKEYLNAKPAKYHSLKEHIKYADGFKKKHKDRKSEMETE